MAGLHRQESKFLRGYRLNYSDSVDSLSGRCPVLQAEPDEPQDAKRVADELNGRGVSVAGMLSAADVVQLNEMTLTTLARFRFR